MVRCFLLFTPSHPCRRVPRRLNHAFSTFTASSPVVSDPPPPHASLFFKSQNPTRPLTHCKARLISTNHPSHSSKPHPFPHISLIPKWNIWYLSSRYRDSRTSNDAQSFHLQICKHGFANDLFLCNTLINVYVRIGALVEAGKLFEEMPEKNSVTWACLISGYTQNGMPNEACAHFKQMVSDGFSPSPYAAVVFFELARSPVLASLSLGCKFMG
ncbi:putative pentatricopeptide repeat-containing protein [Prunus yedoensis var. nudiflora]|uniref:Putative pentatricopeptide repeat-containing protein n=1 Tax=Prunus yedoensis var. nudiflora TaxID=2094558 RepID=A0A314ZTI2_PRUYE|nr:putative pentatricopeptide repeat-containing protein [Prunus yedoensis var. nudiflora]